MENNEEVANKDTVDAENKFSMENFAKKGFPTLMEATRASNSLPQDQSWDLYTAHPAFLSIMDTLGKNALNLMSQILSNQRLRGNIVKRDIDEKFELLVEANDVIMERVGSNLDEMAGLKKNPVPVLVEASISASAAIKTFASPGAGSWNKRVSNAEPISNKIRLLTAHNIQRPQATFKDKVDNSNTTLFKPRIVDKPNSRKPLTWEFDEDGYVHPYDFELENFQPRENQLTSVSPTAPLDINKTPLIRVEDEASLLSLSRDLLKVEVFGVDLEHHSYRTFQGITCLMQISTRKCDYIVDTLILRDKLHILNESFTKPDIVKVLHGADHDILWLQRDLGLYIVNMFDTHQAAKQLEMARLSLAFLLKHYCNVNAEKHFQLADWRIRPLPEELLMYARQDTHYLLYIYDMMRNELINKANGKSNILRSVISKSTDLCKQRYIKLRLLPESYMEMYRKSKRMFDNRQLYAMRELFNWRDGLAREEDESTGYVLPNHMLLQISETLPREMQGILACCNPIPPLVRQNLIILHKMILKAREQPLIKPILQEELRTRGLEQKSGSINIDGPLHCPHDLSQQVEFRDDLPTLLDKLGNVQENIVHNVSSLNRIHEANKDIISCKPKLTIFESPNNSDEDESSQDVLMKLSRITFISPYERYKLVRPFVDSAQNESNNPDEQVVNDENQESIARVKQHFNTLTKNTISQEKKEINTTTPVIQETIQNKPALVDDTELNEPLRIQRKRKRDRSGQAPELGESEHLVSTKKSKEDQDSKCTDSSNTNKELKKDNGRRNNNKKKNMDTPTNKEYKAFDYGSVDFRKYQGGSQTEQKLGQIKSKFKGKGKNNKFNSYKNNKSFTYGGNKGARK